MVSTILYGFVPVVRRLTRTHIVMHKACIGAGRARAGGARMHTSTCCRILFKMEKHLSPDKRLQRIGASGSAKPVPHNTIKPNHEWASLMY
eukprot:353520-Chlamydomonas_euryale.AAC.4